MAKEGHRIAADVSRGWPRVIARELHLSPKTVDVHRPACLPKLGARNTAELVRKVTSGSDEAATTRSGGDEGL